MRGRRILFWTLWTDRHLWKNMTIAKRCMYQCILSPRMVVLLSSLLRALLMVLQGVPCRRVHSSYALGSFKQLGRPEQPGRRPQ